MKSHGWHLGARTGKYVRVGVNGIMVTDASAISPQAANYLYLSVLEGRRDEAMRLKQISNNYTIARLEERIATLDRQIAAVQGGDK
jgi:hypothetical protein